VIVKGGASGGQKPAVDKRHFQNHVVASSSPSTAQQSAAEASQKPVATTSFELRETFKVPPERLYEILTSAEIAQAWANKGAVVEGREGGEFNLFSGQITGRFVKLVSALEL